MRLEPPTPSQRRVLTQVRLRSVSLGRSAALEFTVRASRAALVVINAYPIEERCAGVRPLSFGARPWCDMSAAASNTKPVPHITRRRGSRALSLGRRRSTRVCCARAPYALVAFIPSRAIQKADALARGLFLRAKHCGATSQLWRPTPSPCRVSRNAGTPAVAGSVSLGMRHSTRTCCAREVRALIVVHSCHREGRCASKRPYTPGARP